MARAGAVLLIAGVLSAAPAVAQAPSIHRQIYPAPNAPVSLAGLTDGAVLDTVRTADGLTLKGIESPPRDGKPTFLIFHGNESNAMETMRWFAPLIAQGYGIVAAEYREYDGNPGTASETGLSADADVFYARARQVAGNGKLIVVGHSLGGGVAFGLAQRQRLDALVTIGAFTRFAAMVPESARALVTDRYDNEAAIAALDEPLYLIHGTADETVPFAQGGELADAARKAGKTGAAFVIKDAPHAPDGATLAMILEAIAAKVSGDGRTVSVRLPVSVTIAPFAPHS